MPAIYALVDPRTDEIRYIGKANDPDVRLLQHLKASETGKSRRDKWLHELVTAGLKPRLTILETVSGPGWEDAERKWIAYGREQKWKLTNTAPGGAAKGFVHPEHLSEETRHRLSMALKGRPLSEERRRHIGEGQKGKRLSKEHRHHLGESLRKSSLLRAFFESRRGKPLSEEHRRHISETRKGKPLSEEHRRHLSESSRGKKRGPYSKERRLHISESLQAFHKRRKETQP